MGVFNTFLSATFYLPPGRAEPPGPSLKELFLLAGGKNLGSLFGFEQDTLKQRSSLI